MLNALLERTCFQIRSGSERRSSPAHQQNPAAQVEFEDISDQEAELCIRSARAAKAHHQHSTHFPVTDNGSEIGKKRNGRKTRTRDDAYFDVGLLLDDKDENFPDFNDPDDAKVTSSLGSSRILKGSFENLH